jgi:hypothetical protein
MSENGPYCALTYGVYPTVWFQLKADKYTQPDPELIEHQALREEKVRDEIARRLRCVCGNFSAREFQELVSKMAERQLLDERRHRW